MWAQLTAHAAYPCGRANMNTHAYHYFNHTYMNSPSRTHLPEIAKEAKKWGKFVTRTHN